MAYQGVIEAGNSPQSFVAAHLRMGGSNPQGERLGLNNYYLEKNGQPYIPISGEFHFSRYPARYWEEEIIKMKLAGVDIIATYLFWIYHEEEEGRFVWTGDLNLRDFVALCGRHGLAVILRIGPFVHGECRNGGFPDWLYGRAFEVRTNDAGYFAYVKRFYREIGQQVRGQLFKEGGPIIGVQLENEFMAASAKWEPTILQGDEWIPKGSGGIAHMRHLKELALEAGLDVPFFTCTGWGNAPILEGETLPLWGGYAFQPWLQYWNPEITELPPTDNYLFRDYHRNHPKCLEASYPTAQYPFACCEMGSGMQNWYNSRFIVPPESVTALAINRIGGGCNFIGYYMFHGGSAPIGKHSYLNERCVPKISYDFQAPLGEFGQMKDSYRHLKPIHLFLRDFGATLAPLATVLPEDAASIQSIDTETLRFAVRTNGSAGFIFLTNYQDHAAVKAHGNVRMTIKLPGETLQMPLREGFTLKEDVSAILPFNLNLDGVLLKYATTQLIARLRVDDEPYYFFFAPEGMNSEYCLGGESILAVATERGTVIEQEQRVHINVDPGSNCRITVTTLNRKQVHLVTLNRKQALGIWKIQIWGRERIVLSDDALLTDDGYLELRQIGNSRFDFAIFPDIETGELTAGCGRSLAKSRDGIFTRYSLELPKQSVATGWQEITPGKAVLRIPQDAFGAGNDLFLRIDYSGDVGNAFLDGRLIHDNFCNGAIWEMGLKRFYPEIVEKELVISVLPLRRGQAVYNNAALAIQADFAGEQIAAIRAIELVPEYRAVVVCSLVHG